MFSLLLAVTVIWHGHAFFEMRSPQMNVVIDPFDPTFVQYLMPQGVTADVLLVTHEHKDHNNVAIIGGKPLVFRSEKGVGHFQQELPRKDGQERRMVTVSGVASFHDEEGGFKRGKNTIYCFEAGEFRFCHVGDLGHLLAPEQLEAIGRVDVLMVPVGGFFTLDPKKVPQLIEQLRPRIVVPMHYKTQFTPSLPIASVEDFLSLYKDKKDVTVKRVGANQFELQPDSLPLQMEIWVLDTP